MDPVKTDESPAPPSGPPPLTAAVLAALTEALRGVRYGTVTVIVQDGRVIQIDRTERRRLTSNTDS